MDDFVSFATFLILGGFFAFVVGTGLGIVFLGVRFVVVCIAVPFVQGFRFPRRAYRFN